jgi:hypothetical protein
MSNTRQVFPLDFGNEILGSCTDPNFAMIWSNVLRAQREKEQEWIEKLREMGIAGARPDDGWVDRVGNTVSWQYPYFTDKLLPGALVALGSWEKYRIIKLTGVEVSGFGLQRWRFVG